MYPDSSMNSLRTHVTNVCYCGVFGQCFAGDVGLMVGITWATSSVFKLVRFNALFAQEFRNQSSADNDVAFYSMDCCLQVMSRDL